MDRTLGRAALALVPRGARVTLAYALVGAAVAGTACTRPGASTVSTDAGAGPTGDHASQVLARVGDHTITLGDYTAALQHMDQFDRIRYSAPANRRQLLDEMIDVMLLADEAREKGYDKDPTTQEEVRQILRDALLAKARASAPAPADIPAPEVQAYYDAHRADFRDPERRRVSAIVLASAASGASALQAATKAGLDAKGWGELVRARSVDAAAKPAGDEVPLDLAGDLGFVSPPGDPRGVNARVPDEVRAAVFEIPKVGEVLPRVVEGGGKFYVVKLESKSDARDRTLEDAERSIRVKLAQLKVRAAEDAMLDELRKQYPVQIDEAALSEVKVEAPRSERSEGGAP